MSEQRMAKLMRKLGPVQEIAGTAQDYLERYGAPLELVRAWNRRDERDRYHAQFIFATDCINLRGKASSMNPDRAAFLAARNALMRFIPEIRAVSVRPIENGFQITGANMRFVTVIDNSSPEEALADGFMFVAQQVMIRRDQTRQIRGYELSW